jgi:16S rRNA (guanine527-N7)-methyltransferase
VKRLAEVVQALGGPAAAVAPLARILEIQATDPAASTTVRRVDEAIDRHIADSLVALALPAVSQARRIADLGSGAGWPGLALAAVLPDAHVWLVESAIRRCRYLETASEGLPNVTVVHARAEEWTDGSSTHDLVTARALASLNVVLEYAAPLLAEGGHVVAWKGEISPEEAADGAAAAELLALEPVAVLPVQPFPEAHGRSLHVFRKSGPTPARFPRRAGMATKRPLRAT